MKMPVLVPKSIIPRQDSNLCECRQKPVNMEYKKGVLYWRAQCGQAVRKGDVLCTLEVEKSVGEIVSPCNGLLEKICVQDGEQCGPDNVIGYIATENSRKKDV